VGVPSINFGSSSFQLSKILADSCIPEMPVSGTGHQLIGATTLGLGLPAVPFGQEPWATLPLRCCATFDSRKDRYTKSGLIWPFPVTVTHSCPTSAWIRIRLGTGTGGNGAVCGCFCKYRYVLVFYHLVPLDLTCWFVFSAVPVVPLGQSRPAVLMARL
jgi:hypothetical protein